MDRDRDRDRRPPRDARDVDFPPEDSYRGGRGQSYRPGGARERSPPPRADTYRATRSPPRGRGDYGGGDSYRGAPRSGRSRSPVGRREEYRRPRSPSPGRYRERDTRAGDSFRGRPARSPPPTVRREELGRDDLFRRDDRGYADGRDYRNRDDRNYREERDDRTRDRGYASAAPRSPPSSRYRDRSPAPLPRRGREPSPVNSRGRRSPPPISRERPDSPPPRGRYDDYAPPSSRPQSPPRRRYSPEPQRETRRPPSPRGGPARDYPYRQRSRSPPPRNDRADPMAVDDWRRQPRSPSPQVQGYSRQEYLSSADENGGGRDESATTSRRSSPPVHPSRLALHDDHRSEKRTPRDIDPYDNGREPYRAGRSPEPRDRGRYEDDDRGYNSSTIDDRYDAGIPSGPSRAPPTGPRAPSTTMAPPTGPSAGNVSISAHSRAPPVPPSGPRAAAPATRGDFGGATRGRGGYRGDFGGGRGAFGASPYRGGRGGAAPGGYGRGGASGPGGFGRTESYDRDSDFGSAGGEPPSGPRGDPIGAPPSGPRSSLSTASPVPYRASSNTTTTTYPRSQRFGPGGQPLPESSPTTPANGSAPTGPRASRQSTTQQDRPHPAIADLPKPIPGGQLAEPIADRSRLNKLEEEAERLRKEIAEKEVKKRKSLREWDRLTRETETAALRTALAEESLAKLSGDAPGEGGWGSAF